MRCCSKTRKKTWVVSTGVCANAPGDHGRISMLAQCGLGTRGSSLGVAKTVGVSLIFFAPLQSPLRSPQACDIGLLLIISQRGAGHEEGLPMCQ